jgi:hypothetical protein
MNFWIISIFKTLRVLNPSENSIPILKIKEDFFFDAGNYKERR